MRNVSRWSMLVTLLVAAALSGCAAAVTALKYKDLEVQTRMAETVFLEPVPASERTVWLQVKNTSDQEVDLSPLASMISARGYRIVSDPDAAHYRLQANVLYVGKAAQAAIDQSVMAGFGGPLAGVLIGAGSGAAISQSSTGAGVGAAVGGILGYGAELVAGALVKAVSYAVVTDVQLSERSSKPVSQQQVATITQGTQTQVKQEVSEGSQWRRYKNRIASTATKVNLGFEEAKPQLVDRLMKSIAGMF